ncbi:phytanoyl-CoA dioxygenase family protein [Fictibacillus fluitans]|uniref:Phytanoyl-CoA dioxygenase family protein n=1 Tax=Fictibacillus fluitans TaxID=3058422 RepID=A0ABT8HQC5_9BACL|nr:phytanoyl-CoA dioxygenase family protein [Fictibacillus sp. NE201]MDN4522974.1 phytanoyl-CoA dioxygenase family protein [Fictibacillus sp. NE201]
MIKTDIQNLLSREQIEFYINNGFVKIDNVLSKNDLTELQSIINDAMEAPANLSVQTDKKGGAYYRVLNQKVNLWRDHQGIAKFVLDSKLASIALKLSGSDGIRLFHDHALFKMPGDSKPTPWHQDFPYWPMNREAGKKALSIWIALDDVDETNGCMKFLPESHRIENLKPINLAEPANIFEQSSSVAIPKNSPVTIRMKAGSCTFHHGLTFHFAHSNTTDKPRRALVIIYMPDGTTFNGKNHIITDGLNLQKDERLQGELFPLLAK